MIVKTGAMADENAALHHRNKLHLYVKIEISYFIL